MKFAVEYVLTLAILFVVVPLTIGQDPPTPPSNQDSYGGRGFVSMNLDFWPNTKCDVGECQWRDKSVLSVDVDKLLPYVKFISPSLIRIGGSLEDIVSYNATATKGECAQSIKPDKKNWMGWSNGCIQKSRLKELAHMCHKAGCKFIYGLNMVEGRHVDPNTKAISGPFKNNKLIELLKAAKAVDFPLYAVALGNELAGVGQKPFTDEDALDCFKSTKQAIDLVYPNGPKPLITGMDSAPSATLETSLIEKSFKETKTPLSAFSYHEYVLGASSRKHKDIFVDVMNPLRVPDMIVPKLNKMRQLAYNASKVAGLPHTTELWTGEAGGAWMSGAKKICDRYVSAFWYLQHLAVSAGCGFLRYNRQTLIGGFYGLLDYHDHVTDPKTLPPPKEERTIDPMPDFYVTTIFNKLVGSQLIANAEDKEDTVVLKALQNGWMTFGPIGEKPTTIKQSCFSTLDLKLHRPRQDLATARGDLTPPDPSLDWKNVPTPLSAMTCYSTFGEDADIQSHVFWHPTKKNTATLIVMNYGVKDNGIYINADYFKPTREQWAFTAPQDASGDADMLSYNVYLNGDKLEFIEGSTFEKLMRPVVVKTDDPFTIRARSYVFFVVEFKSATEVKAIQ